MGWEKSFDQYQKRKNEKAKMRNGEQNTRDSRPSALHAMLKDRSHFQNCKLCTSFQSCLHRSKIVYTGTSAECRKVSAPRDSHCSHRKHLIDKINKQINKIKSLPNYAYAYK